MLSMNLPLMKELCLKNNNEDLWKYIDSCALKSWASDYHLGNIKIKLQKAKTLLNDKNSFALLSLLKREILFETNAFMMSLIGLSIVSAHIVSKTFLKQEKTGRDIWDHIHNHKSALPKDIAGHIDKFHSHLKSNVVLNYRNHAEPCHVLEYAQSIYFTDYVKFNLEIKSEEVPPLPEINISQYEELKIFVEDYSKELLWLIAKYLYPNSSENIKIS